MQAAVIQQRCQAGRHERRSAVPARQAGTPAAVKVDHPLTIAAGQPCASRPKPRYCDWPTDFEVTGQESLDGVLAYYTETAELTTRIVAAIDDLGQPSAVAGCVPYVGSYVNFIEHGTGPVFDRDRLFRPLLRVIHRAGRSRHK